MVLVDGNSDQSVLPFWYLSSFAPKGQNHWHDGAWQGGVKLRFSQVFCSLVLLVEWNKTAFA